MFVLLLLYFSMWKDIKKWQIYQQSNYEDTISGETPQPYFELLQGAKKSNKEEEI